MKTSINLTHALIYAAILLAVLTSVFTREKKPSHYYVTYVLHGKDHVQFGNMTVEGGDYSTWLKIKTLELSIEDTAKKSSDNYSTAHILSVMPLK